MVVVSGDHDVAHAVDAAWAGAVLSPRERDVLASMAEGKRGRQIAEELLISADTVRTHTRSIFSKLDVHSRLEAVRIARAAGLRPPGRRGVTGSRSSATVPFRPGTACDDRLAAA